MTNTDLKRLNDIFGQKLGRASNGQPLFKWSKTEDLFYLLDESMAASQDMFEPINDYKKITWDKRIGSGWVIASWQNPGTESQWKSMFGSALPYPPQGMYFPIPNSRIPCEPSVEITNDACSKILWQLGSTFEQIQARCKEEAEAHDAKKASDLADEIDSDWPAFDGQPMSKPYPKDKEISIQ